MRYRPLGRDGRSISAVMLAVGDEPKREADRTRLIYSALESGVNAFELRGDSIVETAASVTRALSAVPRDALFIALRLAPDPRHHSKAFSREWVIHAVERTLQAAGLERLDLLTLQLPGVGALGEEARAAAAGARDADRIGLIGVAGDGQALDEAIPCPEVDVLVTGYNLRSGWPERNRLKAAASRNLVVVGEDSYPSATHGRRQEDSRAERGRGGGGGLFGLGRRTTALEQSGPYGFLGRAPGWTAAELCLSYALTEPALSSMIVEPADPKVMEGLAAAAERDLPTGLPAQIEMARFASV
ncbi:hypothetical protein BH09PSE2_BH09PSE2_08240 [soil metagenome]